MMQPCKHDLPLSQCLQCSEDEITRLSVEVERLKANEDDWRERFAALQGELLGTQNACEGLRTDLAEAQAALSTAERKLDFCTKDYENVAREMSKHLGRPFTSHATDAVIILLDALATARAEEWEACSQIVELEYKRGTHPRLLGLAVRQRGAR